MKYPPAKLREYFCYDPETGFFRWRKHRCKIFVGRVAGCRSEHGYWLLTLFDKKMLAHKVAWAITYGRWPEFDIDHEDLDKGNNRIKNLRRSNKSNNGANRPPQVNNTSGFKGVFWHEGARKWMVQIRVRNKLLYGGLFNKKQEAAKAYDVLAAKHFGLHARLNYREAA